MKNLIMICSLVLIGQVANAGAFIEPYIGYQTGKVEFGSGVEGDAKGTALGLRAGYQMVIPWIALDVELGKGKIDGITPEYDYSYTDLGITVGASVPFVRPFIGYIPSVKHKLKDDTSSYDAEGTGLKIGLGIKILPLIDINIQQTSYEYKEVDGVTVDPKIKNKLTTIGIGMTF